MSEQNSGTALSTELQATKVLLTEVGTVFTVWSDAHVDHWQRPGQPQFLDSFNGCVMRFMQLPMVTLALALIFMWV